MKAPLHLQYHQAAGQLGCVILGKLWHLRRHENNKIMDDSTPTGRQNGHSPWSHMLAGGAPIVDLDDLPEYDYADLRLNINNSHAGSEIQQADHIFQNPQGPFIHIVDGIAAQAVDASSQNPDSSGYRKGSSEDSGSSSLKRSAAFPTTDPRLQRRKTIHLPSSPQLRQALPRSTRVFHIKWQGEDPGPYLTGQDCFVCMRDTAYSPEGSMELPENPVPVAVLPCGHCCHDHCLELITPQDQKANPPCVACAFI